MSNFNINLNINADGETLSSKAGEYQETIKSSKVVDSTDAGTVVLTGSSTLGQANSVKSAKGLMIKNSGDVGAEILIKVDTWAEGNPDSNTDDGESYLSYLLGAGDFIFFPNLRKVAYASTNSAALGGTMNNVDASQLSGVAKKAKDSGATLGANVTTTSGTDITVSSSSFFKVGDLIQLGTTENTGVDGIEIIKVTAIPDATSLTVERGLYGSNAGVNSSQSTGHVSGAIVYLPFFNMYNDQKKYTTPKTNLSGKYHAMNLLGYGRTTSGEADGFVAGSISGKFYTGGYQELGLSGLSGSSESRLTANTAYSFNINVDGAGNDEIPFTTSSNTKLGGSDGVIQKIQDSLNTVTNESGNMAGLKVNVAIVDGDIRFTSLQRHASSSISLVKVSSSIFDSAVGIFPVDTSLQQAVPAQLPPDTIYDKRTYEEIPNVAEMFYDDGFGNINGVCSGSINYETGEIYLEDAPADADFVISANFGSAHSGGNDYNTTQANSILEIKARSVNTKINTTIDTLVVK